MRQRTWLVYLAAVVVVASAYFLIPTTTVSKLLLYNGLGLSAIVAIIVGIKRNRPTYRAPWILFAVGLSSFLTADIVYYVLEAVMDTTPFPSPADAFYLSMYPFVAAGFVMLIRHHSPGRDWPSLIDGGIIATAAFALLWILLMDSYVTDTTLTGLGRIISLAYPVMDVLILVVAARLAAGVHLRHPATALLTMSISSLLIADTNYGLLSSAGTFTTGSYVDAFWLGFYTLFGAAALHPSMAERPTAGNTNSARITPSRLVVLCLATVAVPLIDLVWGEPIDKVVTTIGAVVLFLLVLGRVMGLMRIVTASEDQLRHAATHDTLTGLANRALFTEKVDAATGEGQAGLVTVLFVDLDDFKTINDSLGHEAGDDLLVVVAERLCSCVRDGDVVARLGGDEFAILLHSTLDQQDGKAVAKRILDALDTPVQLADRQVRVTASVGIVIDERHKIKGASLLRSADTAMYLAKERGKGRFEFFDEKMHDEAFERLELKADLANALDRGELMLHYQPILDLAEQRVAGVEALLRWNHPERGLIPPDRFIGLAEQSGLIVPIGRWVLREACTNVRRWQEEHATGGRLGLSVNLSVRQLHDPSLLGDVAEALRISRLDPECLTLEITESMLIGETERGAGVLEQLKALKVRLAIDDFGTGYSSLSYLRRFPVDSIKIDRSFVREIDDSPTSQALVRAVVDLARSLMMTTVAEGVEERSQLLALADLRCGLGQGYLFSRPIDAEAMSRYLADHSASNDDVSGRRRRRNGFGPVEQLDIETVVGLDAIDELRTELHNVHDAASLPLMARLPWLSVWAETHPDWRPTMIAVRGRRRADLEAAALLATREADGRTEVVGMGHGWAACTRLPALRPQAANALARGVVAAIEQLDGDWTFELQQLPAEDLTAELLAQRLSFARLDADLRVPRITLVPGLQLEEYLSHGMRRQLRKANNRIETDGLALDLGYDDDPARVRTLLDEMERIHVSRDHAMGRVSDLDDDCALRFWRSVILHHADRRQVEVGTLRLDGELAAYAVALLDGRAYRVYDGHMDNRFARYSPGRLIETAAIDRAISNPRFVEVDWMTGVGAEKILAANSVETRVRLVAASRQDLLAVAHSDADAPVTVG